MNINILDEYVRLCNKYKKPITFEGIKLFRQALCS
jgi:hypothetical protein